MFGLLAKISAIRTAYAAGDYKEAGRLVWELLGDFMGYTGQFSAGLPGDDDPDKVEAEVEGLMAMKAPVGAAPVGDHEPAGNPAVVLALIQLLGPLLVEWIRKRRQNG